MYVKESIEFPNTKHFHLMQGSIRLSYILFLKVCSLNKYVKWKLFAFCLLTWICIKFSNRRKVFFYLRLSLLIVPFVGFMIDERSHVWTNEWRVMISLLWWFNIDLSYSIFDQNWKLSKCSAYQMLILWINTLRYFIKDIQV